MWILSTSVFLRQNVTPHKASTPVEPDSCNKQDDSLLQCSRQCSYSDSSLHDSSLDRIVHATAAHTPDYSKCSMALRKATSLSHFLVTPTPPKKLVTKQPKTCGGVLTSRENIQQLEVKEAMKEAMKMCSKRRNNAGGYERQENFTRKQKALQNPVKAFAFFQCVCMCVHACACIHLCVCYAFAVQHEH